jgi:hypothetical protein
MTEVFFNGLKADVEDSEVIAATYGSISFGEFNKKKGVRTNSFKLPITNRNKEIFENPDIVQNDSDVPYIFLDWEVRIFGITVISGFAYITEAEDFFEVQTVNGISDFYATITAKKLNELDLSEYNHLWNRPNIEASWTNTDGYVYAHVQYGLAWENRRIHPKFILPQIYFHTIVKKIVNEAGFKIDGKVLEDTRFLNHVIVYNQWPIKATFDGPITLNDGLPDVSQSKVILDFMNIYGLMASINNDDMIITFNYIDDIIFNKPIDWSRKIDETDKPKRTFTLDYFIDSKLSFKTDDQQTNGREYVIAINDETLEKEGFIYESAFYVADVSFYLIGSNPAYPDSTTSSTTVKEGIGQFVSIYDSDIIYGLPSQTIHQGNWFKAVQPSGVPGGNPAVTPGTDETYWKLAKESEIMSYKSRPMYGVIENVLSWPFTIGFSSEDVPVTKVIQGELLDWQESYRRHFRVFDMIIRKTKVVELLLKLNYSDINQLDFTSPYWFDRFDSLFLLEEVKDYKLNEIDSTVCRFIRL